MFLAHCAPMIARLKEFLRVSFQVSLGVQSALGSWKRGYWEVIPLSVIGTIFVIIMASDLAKSSHVAYQVVMYVMRDGPLGGFPEKNSLAFLALLATWRPISSEEDGGTAFSLSPSAQIV